MSVASDPMASPTDCGLPAVDLVLESVLAEVASLLPEPAGGELSIDLAQDLATWVRRPGKRVRPAFAWWGWMAAGGSATGSAGLARLGAALELLHLFALVQDDVMDRSSTRRGLPAAHVAAASRHREAAGLGDPALYGDSVATLLSDLALSEAAGLVAGLAPDVRRHWRVMTLELVHGQLLDLTQAAARHRDLETARRVGMLKTARYSITRPLELGALTAGADAGTDAVLLGGLAAWGDLVGEAFALRDDVLGVWGDPTCTGKPCGDDLRSRKPTRLLTWAVERLPAYESALLADTAPDDDTVRTLADAMARAGVRERAEYEIEALVRRAGGLLADLPVHTSALAPLGDLAAAMAWRDA